MPLAELQRPGRFAVEPANDAGCHSRDHLPMPLAQRRDDGADALASNWDALWIDMGGEG